MPLQLSLATHMLVLFAAGHLLACAGDLQGAGETAGVAAPGTGGSSGAAAGRSSEVEPGQAGRVSSADMGGRGEPQAGRGEAGMRGAAGQGGSAGSPPQAGAGALPDITLWIAGDSTVANGVTPCPRGWGGHVRALFDDRVQIVNRAMGGRSVRTWLYDVQSELDDRGECVLARDGRGQPLLRAHWQDMLDGMQAGDALLIQFGINDSSRTCDRHVGVDAFIESYGYMAMSASERGAHPIFLTAVSSIACDGAEPRATRGQYAAAAREAGERFDVPVIDLEAASVALYDERGFCPLADGDVSASTTGPVGDFFCDDHTHFSNDGAAEIARLVTRALDAQNLPLANYLR